MVIEGKKIAIIGGGPGGLTLARLLQLQNVDVKIYERDAHRDARIQGGTLDLHEDSGLAALAKAGLMEAFKANYRPGADLTRVVDNQAKIHYDQHYLGKKETFGDQHHRPEIDRGPLRDILLDSLHPNTVVWDSYILALEKQDAGWKIIFQNGNTALADIIIGADGANSKIRPFVTDIKPEWSGITMLEGLVKHPEISAPNIHKLLKGGKIFAFGNNKTLIVSSKGDGSLSFATSCATDEHWVTESGIDFQNHRQVLAWFKTTFSEWSSVWHELFGDESTQFIPRPQYCMPLQQKWTTQSNITLLGDAAHWMPPFAGEGVNMAMLDALELSESLTNPTFADIQAALEDYEKKMLARFAKIGQETLFNTEWMHQPNALRDMLRMFSGNFFTQIPFLLKMWTKVRLLPTLKKVFRIA